MIDLFRCYLKEIGRHPLLTPEEEIYYASLVKSMVQLAQKQKDIALKLGKELRTEESAFWLNVTPEEIDRINYQGLSAKKKIANANLRLVVTIAKKYQNRNLEFSDLIQEGSLGLYQCIDKFDPGRGNRFSTYAYWWIRQGITRAIAEKANTIRLPFNISEKLNKIKRLQGELHHTLGRYPTINEIAQASDFSKKKVVELLKYSTSISPTSLNLPIGKDKEFELGELMEAKEIPLTEQVDQGILRDEVNNILCSPLLTDIQREVLILRYGINSEALTLKQAAKRLSLSPERVRQIQVRAIELLQHKLRHREYNF